MGRTPLRSPFSPTLRIGLNDLALSGLLHRSAISKQINNSTTQPLNNSTAQQLNISTLAGLKA
ncbi:hypothetical protein [Tannerella forsythia]|uniref:hypothetical protein n=1 Tax=Tannerella forsythia TaxID=28112 RepID=UPI00159F1510|nr:hypothetical protein [Tannerella forsythia]